ncbi:hypothetical protein [Sphingobium vermicomposti]|uniref:hypothetical protein n=1 Tax=Sphingobium vermicomposti TaxID=529005 RepID=UPI00141E24A2|nr:hypothetical protein [Sphingobium vermicomposti]
MSEGFSISCPVMIELIHNDGLAPFIDMDVPHYLLTAAPDFRERIDLHRKRPHHLGRHVPIFHQSSTIIGVAAQRRHLNGKLVRRIHLHAQGRFHLVARFHARQERQSRVHFCRRHPRNTTRTTDLS